MSSSVSKELLRIFWNRLSELYFVVHAGFSSLCLLIRLLDLTSVFSLLLLLSLPNIFMLHVLVLMRIAYRRTLQFNYHAARRLFRLR